MASINNKFPENVPGTFYVDNQCIDCDLCRQTAPNFFTRKSIGGYGYSFLQKQPTSERDVKICQAAMEACPVEAIGKVKTDAQEVFVETSSTEDVPSLLHS